MRATSDATRRCVLRGGAHLASRRYRHGRDPQSHRIESPPCVRISSHSSSGVRARRLGAVPVISATNALDGFARKHLRQILGAQHVLGHPAIHLHRARTAIGALAVIEEGIVPRQQQAMSKDRRRDRIDRMRANRAVLEAAQHRFHPRRVGRFFEAFVDRLVENVSGRAARSRADDFRSTPAGREKSPQAVPATAAVADTAECDRPCWSA